MKNLTLTLLCAATIVGMIGCAVEPIEPDPVVQNTPPKKILQAFGTGKCGASTVSQVYPHTGALRIDKTMPKSVQFNAPFEYTLRVTNLTDLQLSSVVVKDRLPEGLNYISSAPKGNLDSNVLTWAMSTLEPRASKMITVKVSPTRIGCLETCADASYTVLACAKTEVVQPALALTKSAPASVIICDPILMTFVVTNEGTGTAMNVKLTETLPLGLTTQDGTTSINLSLGNLVPGQSETRTVTAKAAKPGTYTNQAMAVADGNLKAQSEMISTVVTQPVLAIAKSGPKKIYLGHSFQYDITVTNNGDTLAANTVVTDTIPADVTNIKPSGNGALSGNVVTWKLGDLAPKATKKVTIAYNPSKPGTHQNTAMATATCAGAVSASATTNVDTISAILLEVIDLSDPIEVGKDVTYVITATNQGSAPATNILIKAMLEKSMEYVGNSGTTRGAVSGNTVSFDPLPSLASKDKATWKVVVKAIKEGDVRFGVTMNSDQLTRDVQETEATKFYE